MNARRDVSEPERHAEWDDVMVVQSGFGSVEYSRAIKGGSHYSRGEWRGGVLTPAPTSVELVPG